MKDELFDIVDSQDRVIGQRYRSEVHQLGLRHRSVHLFAFNTECELFLQKRSMSKDYSPGKWDSSASGHVDAGEDYDSCVVREAREELGVKLTEPPKKLFKLNACPQTEQEFVWLYSSQHNGPFRLHPEEISDGNWFTMGQIDQWMKTKPADFASSFGFIWQQYKHHIADNHGTEFPGYGIL